MGKSYKKTPKRGITSARTEKEDKRKANRKLRHIHRRQVHKGTVLFALLREVSDVWAFGKDGKIYQKKPTRRDIQK